MEPGTRCDREASGGAALSKVEDSEARERFRLCDRVKFGGGGPEGGGGRGIPGSQLI